MLFYMGAGILPVSIKNNKLYFLFGKENKFETSAPGFSDFGGGTDNDETFIQTAVREASEELTGFLGTDEDIKKQLVKSGSFFVDVNDKYRMYILPMKYDPMIEFYYNNNQNFIQKRLDQDVIKNSKIFEKSEIRWICIDDLIKQRLQFRHYFRGALDLLLQNKNQLKKVVKQHEMNKNKKTRRNTF